jgi:hypothetical protein
MAGITNPTDFKTAFRGRFFSKNLYWTVWLFRDTGSLYLNATGK